MPVTKGMKKDPATIAQLKEDFLNYYREVPIQKYAAQYIKRDEHTISQWKKDDPAFRHAIDQMESIFLQKNLLKSNAEWKLERMFKKEFSQRTEITGKEGEPIQVESVTKLSDDELDRLLLEGARARKAQAGRTD